MRARKLLLHSAIALALAVAIGGALVQRTARDRVADMARWADQAEAAWKARDFARQPLYGTGQPGSAETAYDEAVALAASLMPGDEQIMRDLRSAPHRVTDADVEALLARWAPALAKLRAGAQCTEARPAIDWSKGFSHPVQNLLRTRALVNCAVVAARRHLAAQRGRAAVEVTLDAATLGVDLLRAPVLIEQMIGCAMIAIATDEAWRDVDLRQLDAEALALLDGGLARLDALCPPGTDLTGEALSLARTLLDDDLQRKLIATEFELPCSWRYGWSARWASADAVLLEAELCTALAHDAEQAWPLRQARIEALFKATAIARNPLLAIALPSVGSAERTLRDTRTRLRLLRLAVAWHRGDDLPALVDPLGAGPFAMVHGERAVTFQSAEYKRAREVSRATATTAGVK